MALVRVCARLFKIDPVVETHSPDLDAMLDRGDAALMIGDNALIWEPETVRLPSTSLTPGKQDTTSDNSTITKIDLGEAWTSLTGLPFVWAFWAGPAGALSAADVDALQEARNAGVEHSDAIGRGYFRHAPQHRDLGARYLRDNIKYHLGADERAGLELFYRYANEIGAAPGNGAVQFF